MPFFVAPHSDEARLAFLEKTEATATQDQAAGNSLLSAELLSEIHEFLTVFTDKVKALTETLGARIKETREAQQSIDLLTIYLRDLWEVLKRRVTRLNQPAEILTYYQLPLDGIIPKPASRDEWLKLADLVVAGEATAVAKGYPPMQNPSVDELKVVLATTRKEISEIAPADRTYDAAQQAVAALRPKADELISEIMDELRFKLRRRDASGQRRVMRSYGANFKYLPGEPIEDITTPPETPPTA